MAVRRPAPKTPAVAPAPAPKAAASAPKAAPKVEAKPAAKPAVVAVGADVAGIQENLRKAAAKSLEQGRAAFDKLKEASDETTQALEASLAASAKGAAELAAKALEAVKTNTTATFDHLKALAGSKNLADAVSLHGQFIRHQAEAAVAQAKEFAELAKKTAVATGAPIQAQLKKPLTPKG